MQTIVMALVGIALGALGYLMATKEAVAAWGLRHGSGKIWVSLLGWDRALWLTRRVFGPLVVVLGLLCLLMALVAR